MFLGSLLKVRHKPKEGQTYQIPPTANFFGEVSRGSGDREGGRYPPPFQIFEERGQPPVGVYIQQAPFVKNAIFGFNFKVLLGYSQ